MFRGIFKRVSREVLRSLKEVQRVFYASFKADSKSFKKFSRVFKERVKCVSRIFHKKFQGCFKYLSMKLCFCNFVVA